MDRLSTKGQMIDQIDLRNVAKSAFDRSNHNYGTGRLGTIMPTRLDEVYPGDMIKGAPEMVVNFEPLVAPLMGSMVLKQESFFVPLPQIWRHSYKFFTGKNGFNENMPSVTPRRIWSLYCNYPLKVFANIGHSIEDLDGTENKFAAIFKCLNAIYISTTDKKWSDVAGSTPFYSWMVSGVEQFRQWLYDVYEPRKMYDLALPAYQILERFLDKGNSDGYLQNLSFLLNDSNNSHDFRKNVIIEFCSVFGNVITDVINYFVGPSSLFDYLGWPVVSKWLKYDSQGDPIVVKEWNITNCIQFYLLACVQAYGATPSIDLRSYLQEFFSEIPLVFGPFKAYYLIWYWNYRDQLLETDILDPEEDEFLGSNITDNVILYCTLMRQRCWFKDTFTTALTNTGDGNLFVPTANDINTSCELVYYDDNGQLINTSDGQNAFDSGATSCKITLGNISYKIPMNYLRGSQEGSYSSIASAGPSFISLDMFDRIRRLRSVVQKRLILGYEVDDVVWSSFMVRMSNVRLHIPEILGRGRDSVVINTLVNNTSTSEQIAGDKSATAFAHGQMSQISYFSEEWGYYMQFATIMPIQSYAGGMQRLYLKRDPLDYMWPEYATMGMDAVYNTELAALGTRLNDDEALKVFGYQGRYYDLKSRLDEEHGRLLTDLNYLTFSREWDSKNPPLLNYIFVHCWPRLDGFVLESPNEDVFRYDCYTAQGWERRLPVPSEIVG